VTISAINPSNAPHGARMNAHLSTTDDYLNWLEAYPLGTIVGSGERATATPELCQRAAEALVDAVELLSQTHRADSRSA